nr:hypothetical protein [Tanacetum cinerariifolium]
VGQGLVGGFEAAPEHLAGHGRQRPVGKRHNDDAIRQALGLVHRRDSHGIGAARRVDAQRALALIPVSQEVAQLVEKRLARFLIIGYVGNVARPRRGGGQPPHHLVEQQQRLGPRQRVGALVQHPHGGYQQVHHLGKLQSQRVGRDNGKAAL